MPGLTAVAEQPSRKANRSDHDSQERRHAATIQRSFLPALPVQPAPGFTFTGFFQPVDELGGDFYGISRLDDGTIGFYLADVSGHELAAALLTVWLRQQMQELREWRSDVMRSPVRVFENIHERMASDRIETTFFTMVYGVLDPRMGKLRCGTAGHPSPLKLRGQTAEPIAEANGPILSAQFGPEIGWSESTTFLRPGDGLLLFSDGVIDACDWQEQALGMRGLQAIACKECSVDRSAMAIGAAVQHAVGYWPPEDDMTLLLLSVLDEQV